MKNESSVPAAQKMMDVTLPIFPVEVQNTLDSDDRSHRHPGTANIVPLRAYLHANYQRVHVFPDGEEAWDRK
jgi:hypothetical protein